MYLSQNKKRQSYTQNDTTKQNKNISESLKSKQFPVLVQHPTFTRTTYPEIK